MQTLKETYLDQCTGPQGFQSGPLRLAPPLAPLSQSLPALQPLSHPSHLQQDCEAAALPAACSGIQHLSPRYPTPAKPHSVHNQQITCLSWLMIHCETRCGGLSSCLQGYWRLDIIWAWHCWTKTKRTACHFIKKFCLVLTSLPGLSKLNLTVEIMAV